MISELLCIKHHYFHLTCLTIDDVDFMIEFISFIFHFILRVQADTV